MYILTAIKTCFFCLLCTVSNFPVISSNIPASPAYRVYISQLIRFSRDCTQNSDVMHRAEMLKQKLLKQGYFAPRWKSCITINLCVYHTHIARSDGIFMYYCQIYFTYVERIVATRIYSHKGISRYSFSWACRVYHVIPVWQYFYIYLIQEKHIRRRHTQFQLINRVVGKEIMSWNLL